MFYAPSTQTYASSGVLGKPHVLYFINNIDYVPKVNVIAVILGAMRIKLV